MFLRNKLMAGMMIAGLGFGGLAAAAQAQNPATAPNNSYISLTGTVADVNDDEFALDYGPNMITVEMDDWSWYDTDARLAVGDTVQVRGYIDDDLFDTRTIDADQIYVYNRYTYYYPDNTTMDYSYYSTPALPPELGEEGTWYSVYGNVVAVNGTELTLDTGTRNIQVETAYMDNKPLDNQGFPRVRVGDSIYVSGILDHNFFEASEVEAQTIVTMNRDGSITRSN